MVNKLNIENVIYNKIEKNIDEFIGEHILMGSKSVYIIVGNDKDVKQTVLGQLNNYGINFKEINDINNSFLVDLT